MRVILIGFFIALADQVTKYVVRANFALGESRTVVDGLFNFTYIRNTGAAWGMLNGQNIGLAILSIAILVLMVIFRKSFLTDAWEQKVAFGLMIGGIVGNFIDRVKLGWVTDFLDFYWRGHHWPAFNIADAAICTGVGIYIISTVILARHPLHEEAAAEEGGKTS